MRRLKLFVPVIFLITFAAGFAGSAVSPRQARAAVVFFGNHQGSCPDPQSDSFVLACTSDFATDVFPLYRPSNSRLTSWHHVANAFPVNHQPYWAIPAPVGRFWAPDLHRVNGNWVLYFAAEQRSSGSFVIGVAWGRALKTIWTHTRVLHYVGQFNAFNPSYHREIYGGVIDPAEAKDPNTGQRYLVWSEQHSSIWAAPLTNDGLHIRGNKVSMIMHVQSPTDCEVNSCVVEGSALTFHNGLAYLLYSVRSTWDWSYAMRAAWSHNPLSFYRSFPGYILRAGNGWSGPGGGAAPVRVGKNRWVEFYHAMRGPDQSHISSFRMLMMGSLVWHGLRPVINGGIAG